MLEAKIPWNERRDTPTTIVRVILASYFGITALEYFGGALFSIGKTGAAQLVIICAVLWAAAAILMYTALRFWRRRPDAIRWGFISLVIVIAIWMKWPMFSEIYTTSIAAAALIWVIY